MHEAFIMISKGSQLFHITGMDPILKSSWVTYMSKPHFYKWLMLFESQCCSAFLWEMIAFKYFLWCHKLKIKEMFFNVKLLNEESIWEDMGDVENCLWDSFSDFADIFFFQKKIIVWLNLILCNLCYRWDHKGAVSTLMNFYCPHSTHNWAPSCFSVCEITTFIKNSIPHTYNMFCNSSNNMKHLMLSSSKHTANSS